MSRRPPVLMPAILLPALLFSGLAAAEDIAALPPSLIDETVALREAARTDDIAWHALERLTTEIGPRLAGSAREAAARELMAEMLQAAGFANVRIEPFEMQGWARGAERAEILGPSAQPLLVTALGGSVATPEAGLEAEVRRFADLHELEALEDGALAGAIAFIDLRMFRAQDGSGYGNTNHIRRDGPSLAARKGASAVIIRSVGTDSHRFPHTGGTRYAEDVARIPAAALSNPDADQLARLLARGPVRLHLTLTPKALGPVSSGNVIAEIPGSDLREEIVLIGGHLDSWDLGTGAIDDGAGIAITMAAAQRILKSGKTPRRTIRLILWGAEEPGLLGARAYAEAHKDELGKHVLASESDFGAGRIWRFDTRFGAEDLPLARAMHRLLRPLGIGFGNNEAGGGPDVIPLRMGGVPAVSLQQDGTDYFDLHHTPDDTLDKVDPEALRQNVAAWTTLVWLAANIEGDLRPAQAAAN